MACLYCLLSSVTRACNPSGGIKVTGRWVDLPGWISVAYFWPARSKRGVGSRGLGEGLGFMALRAEALRQVGFTEQRLPPLLCSGRITSRHHLDPLKPVGFGPNWTVTFLSHLKHFSFTHWF
ncbi:UNVERIFIED_CONTAM: hypothetical protein Slati_4027100 [Sesamum latifolium]|uniref:Uncharacterized protein n=1 Tax=Sesamum latifolium TaxID=2727402 RepID=A0AAW2TR89_9LAMI